MRPPLEHRLAHRLAEEGNANGKPESSEIAAARSAIAAAPARLRATKAILPVMDPRFNLREIAKQLILLEDHLSQPRRRCPDCIRKHFATVEAFCEEAITLDKEGTYHAVCGELQERVRELQAELARGETTFEEAAQQLRAVRKPLLQFTTQWLLEEKYGRPEPVSQRSPE